MWLPAEDEAVVWHLSLALSPAMLAACRRVLSADELERTRRLLSPVHYRRRLAAWGQLRWFLGYCFGVEPRELRFAREPWGRPYLANGSGLDFNLAHSDDVMLVAVTWRRRLGVDLEAIRPLSRLEALARRCLADGEWTYWHALTPGQRQGTWFRYWTLKEAFVKADGRGLGLGLQRCVFQLEPLRLLAVPEGCGDPADWQVFELDVGSAYRAALCVRGGPVRVVQRRLPPDWLSGSEAATAEGVENGRRAFQFPQGTGDEQD